MTTINEFIAHLKHKSLILNIKDEETKETLFNDALGAYLTSLNREKTGGRIIKNIYVYDDELLEIYVKSY